MHDHHENHDSDMKQITRPTQKRIKCSKKQPSNSLKYFTMESSVLKTPLRKLPEVELTTSLDDTQAFALSFINAHDDTIVNL